MFRSCSCDGNGLYLLVRPTGSRSWVQRLVIRGQRRDLGLGGFPLVSLKEAREEAFANRKLARAAGDPLAEKRRATGMLTFAAAAERVWNDKNPGWRHPQHAQDWMSSLTRYVLPHIGKMPVCDVTSADVLDTLRRIWHVRPATARRVRQRIGAVMDWAIALEFRTDNPCDRLGPVLGPQQDLVQHMRALPHAEVAAAIRTVWASGATTAVKLAFEFLVLTAARSGEVRGARWAEIDLSVRVWTIPATRMKAKRVHRIPLSGRAAQILEAARALGDGRGPLVFPSKGRNPISITRLPGCFRTTRSRPCRMGSGLVSETGQTTLMGSPRRRFIDAGERVSSRSVNPCNPSSGFTRRLPSLDGSCKLDVEDLPPDVESQRLLG